MKKCILLIATLLSTISLTKASVYKDTLITVGGSEHPLRIAIPEDYDALQNYPLIIGLHYCTGTSLQYRDALRPLSDSLNVIIACPDNNTQQMTDPAFILASIDTMRNLYNIDTTEVYLTGMSCNGFSLLQMGLENIYPFKGIFPWVPYFSTFTSNTFNLDSEMPVVISVGTLDQNYTAILQLYDSLAAHQANVDLVLVKNVAHTLVFQEFSNEMTRCVWYLNDTNAIEIDQPENISMLNTDAPLEIKVHFQHLADRNVIFRTLSSHVAILPESNVTIANDTAIFTLSPIAGHAGLVHYVLEATEEGGNGIEQMVFKINVTNPPTTIADETQLNQIEVFPVPADDKLFIRCNNKRVNLKVYNSLGSVVLSKENFITESTLDISSLSDGIYFLNAKNEDFDSTVQFIIQ